MKKNPLGCIFPTCSFAKSIKLFSLLFAFVFYTNVSFSQTDTCTTPTSISIGATCTTTNYNVASGFNNDGQAPCTGTSFRDGWYIFTTGATTTSISIQGTSNRQMGIAIYTGAGACNALIQQGCIVPGAANATLNATVTPSTTYKLRIMRTNNNTANNMTGTICIVDTTPASVCGSTTNIASCGTLVNTTIAAGTGSFGTSACSFTTGGIERVFTFTPATTGAYTIQQASSFAYIDYQFRTVASGCAAAGWTCIDDLSGASNSPSFTLTGGVQYYLLLDPESTAGGNISFTIGCPIVAPSNDDCNNAIPLTLNTSCSYSNYTTAGATASTTPSTPPVPGCASYSGGDVWFSFLVPANGEVTVDTQTGGMTDSGMAWYTGTCGALSLLECDDDDSANGLMSSITRTGLTPGTTIYVRFWEYSNDNPGTFGICATSPGPCTTPGAQANGFTPGTITSTSFPATFSGTADSYLVIQSTSATPPTHPVNGTIYNAGNIATLGAGLTFVQSGASTSITGTGLTGNTHYYYYIYAFNNAGCTGGPLYNAGGPLTGNAVTCPAAPSPISTSSTLNSINFTWPSSIGGGSNAVTYTLQVTTDAGFTANVAGSPFTINDPTVTYNLTGLAANTIYYYRIRANNGCSSSYTTGSATTGYCVPAPTSVDGTGITNVTMGTINNNTGAEAGNYGNYSAMSTTGSQGETIPFSIRFSTSGFGYDAIIWIDWNNDLDFDDTGELMFSGTSPSTNPGILTGSFQIPATAILGNHRLRIGGVDFGPPTPCYTGSYGTYEDYTINVIAATCPGPSNITVNLTSQTTATINWTAATPAPSNGYQYYLTTSATIPNGATIPTGSVGAGVTTLNLTGLTIGATYYIWIRSNCGGTQGFWIGTSFVAPTCLIGNSTGTSSLGCPSVVGGGLGLSGADHAAISCTAASTCVDLEATYLNLGNTTSYTVESITYAPPYQFGCLKNPVSVNIDDRWSPVVNLPFDFCFYGNTYNQCLIGSNGIITFDLVGNTPEGYCGYSFADNLPQVGHSSLVENSIFGAFHDIDPGISGEVGWELITLNSGCRALVASWSDVPMFSSTCNSQLYTGMIVLYENTNVIEVYLEEKNTCASWNGGNAVVGIQNATGTTAVVAPNRNGLDADWTVTNEAWRFVPAGASITTLAWHEGSGTSGPVLGTSDIITVCPGATTTYTAEITYTLCDGTTLVETDETTVTVTGSKVWDGSVNSQWNNANNWTPVGVPTAADCVLIPPTANNPIISGASYNGLGLNLTIQNGATLTVNPTNNVTITDWVNINAGGNLQLDNTSSLIQVNNNPNTGIMHMDRTVSIRKQDYVYWSSPVSSFASSAISPGTSAGYIYKWIPTIGANTNGFGNWTYGSENMVIGKGYIVRGPNAYTNTLTPFTATFIGTPNNGIITTPILRGTYNGANYSTGVSTTLGTSYDDNWNLIGNPYPSAVNAINFLTTNTNIDGFIKIWTHGTLPSNAIADPFYNNYVYNYTPADYITYNITGTSSGPGVFGGNIAAGQGFFVSMLHTSVATSENVTFNNSMRNSTNNNSQFFKNTTTSDDNNGRIWLDLIAADGSNVRNLIGYVDGASNNRDRLYDAITDVKLNLNLYSKIGDEPMTIQGRTLPFDELDLVPMGIKVPQTGNYSIGIGTVDGFFTNTNQNIYLEDLDTNIIHDLRQNPYTFSAIAGDDPDRFILRYTNNTLGNDDITNEEANVWAISSEILSIKSTKNTIKSIRVFDVLGRLLADYPEVNGYEIPLTKIQKNKVALIIQVTLSNGTIVNKKIIY